MPTLTITTNAAQDRRITTAFGRLTNRQNPDRTPRDATAAEVKEDVIEFIRSTVINHEQDIAMQAAGRGVPPIDPT